MKESIEEILINEIGNENDVQILFDLSSLIRYLDSKMWEGINIQDKLIVLHDVDVLWRLSDVELLEVEKKEQT